MTSVQVLVGNPQTGSRTRTVAEVLAAALAARTASATTPPIDLADVADRLFRFPDEIVDALLAQVAASELLVVASPTYKASYTGLLKAFLDRYGTNGLAGVVAIPVFTIGSPAHALAVEFTLRPLLVELGASVPTRGLAFPTAEFDDRQRIIEAWLDEQWPALAASRS